MRCLREKKEEAEKEAKRYKDTFGVLGNEVDLAQEVKVRQDELDSLKVEMKKLKIVCPWVCDQNSCLGE